MYIDKVGDSRAHHHGGGTGIPPVFAVMTGVFDGFHGDGDTYEFLTGATLIGRVLLIPNPDLYPLHFPEGGGEVCLGCDPGEGAECGHEHPVRVRGLILIRTTTFGGYENVLISGGLADYSVQIPPQDATQEYNSFLMYIVERDQSVMVKDIEVVMYGDGPTEPMDTDGDGVPDDEDAFPNDPAASVDDDMDGMPDAWNDGVTYRIR